MKPGFSLKQISSSLVILAVLTPALLLTYWHTTVTYQYRLESTLSSAQTNNELLGLEIELELARLKAILSTTSDTLAGEVHNSEQRNHLTSINSHLANLLENEPTVREAALFAAGGNLLAINRSDHTLDSDQRLTKPTLRAIAVGMGFADPGSRPEITLPLSGQVHTGTPGTHYDQNKSVFSLSLPVGSPVVAVLMVIIDIDTYWFAAADENQSSNIEISHQYLLDGQGVMIAGAEYPRGKSMAKLPIVNAALSGQPWLTEHTYLNKSDQAVFGTYTPIETLGWWLVTEINSAEIKQPILNSLTSLIIPLLIGIALLIWFEFYLIKFVTGPIHIAGEAIKRVTQGNYQFEIASSGIREFDTMGEGFKKMALAREQVEAQLYEREQDLAVTLDSMGDGVIVTGIDGHIKRMNAAAEQITSWQFAQAQNQPLEVVLPIIDQVSRSPIENIAKAVIAEGSARHIDDHITLISQHNTERQLSITSSPIQNSSEQTVGAVLVFSDITAAYRAREADTQIQRQLQGMFDGMQGLVIQTGPEGNITFHSERLNQVINKPSAIDTKLWEMLENNHYIENATQINQIKELCQQAASGTPVQKDIKIIADDQTQWRAYSIYPVMDDHGKVVHLIHQTIDITERKLNEEAAQAALELLQLYRDHSPLATIAWNMEMEIVDWNPAATELFGYSEQEARTKGFAQRLSTPDSFVVVNALWAELMDGKPNLSTVETRAKNGQLLLSEWHSAPLRDLSGQVIGVACRVIDITAEFKAKQSLLSREYEQREILDSMLDAVMSIDLDGILLSFNRAAEMLFGFSKTEIIGQNVNRLLAAPSKKQFTVFKQRFRQGDKRLLGKSQEMAAQNSNGDTFPVRLTMNALPDDGSGTVRLIGSCHDLSTFKQQEIQLRRAQRMDALGKLTGGIAHDFNNMLGVVIGYSSMLKRKLSSEPKLAKQAGQILHAAQRGASLTTKLLSFSRHQETVAARVDVNQLIREQLEILEKTLTVRITLNIDLDPQAWPVWLDNNDLEDALLNISINASHAIPDSSADAELAITSRNCTLDLDQQQALGLNDTDYLRLTLQDNGIGMDEETKEKIFDPFFSTKGVDGTGLGLSQVFGFITRANGAIRVHSTPGIGSEFTLYLPRYKEQFATHSEPPALDQAADMGGLLGNGERILVVDDEADLNEFITELLTEQGYQVFSATNSKGALEILNRQPIDLLYCDVVMPGVDGYQLAEHVQQLYPQIIIQMTSGYTDDRQQQISDQSLHQNILYKPVDSNRLLNRIRRLLG